MRELIENPVYMSSDEIRKYFDGKWVLITNCRYSENRDFLGGFPVAVADSIFKGQSDGFYDEFKKPKYTPRTYRDYCYYDNGIEAFFDSIGKVSENVQPYNR